MKTKRCMSECRSDPNGEPDLSCTPKKMKVLNTIHQAHSTDNVHTQHQGEGDTLHSATTKAPNCSKNQVSDSNAPEIDERYQPLTDISDDKTCPATAAELGNVLHDSSDQSKSSLYDSHSHSNSELYATRNGQDKQVLGEGTTHGIPFVSGASSGAKHSVTTNSVSQLSKNDLVHNTRYDYVISPSVIPPSPLSVTNVVLCTDQDQQKENRSMLSVNHVSDAHTFNHMDNSNMVSTSQHLANSQYPLTNHTEKIQQTNYIPPDCCRYGDIQQNMPQFTPQYTEETTADLTEASIAALQLVQELASNSQSANNQLPPINSVMEQHAQNTSNNMVAHAQYQNINTSNQLQNKLSSNSFFQNPSYYQQKENQANEIEDEQRFQQRPLSQNLTVDSFGRQVQSMSYGPRQIIPEDRAASAFNDLSQNNKCCKQQELSVDPAVFTQNNDLSQNNKCCKQQELSVNPAVFTQNNDLQNPYGVYTQNSQTSHSQSYSHGDHLNSIPPMESQRFPEHLNRGMDLRNRQPYAVQSLEDVSPYHNPSHHPHSLHAGQWSGPTDRFHTPRYQESTLHSGHNLRSRSVSLTNNLECLNDPTSPAILKRQKNRRKSARHSHSIEHELPMTENDRNYRFAGIPQPQNKPTELWVVNPSYAMNVSRKTLMSQYIEFLIEENEQITEMSQSFSLPVDIIVTEDLYIIDIARKDTPFPTPKFLDWVHKCYPRIDVKSFIYRPALCTREREMRRYYNYNMPPQQLLEETFFYFQRKRMGRYCPTGPPI